MWLDLLWALISKVWDGRSSGPFVTNEELLASSLPIFIFGKIDCTDFVCSCPICGLNLTLALLHKNKINKIVPKFICEKKRPEFYSGFRYEQFLCAQYLCVNYTINCLLSNAYYIQRIPEEFYKEVEEKINLENDTNFSEIKSKYLQYEISCIDEECCHSHYLREEFTSSIVINGTPLERCFKRKSHSLELKYIEEESVSIEENISEYIPDESIFENKDIGRDFYDNLQSKGFPYCYDNSLYFRTLKSKIPAGEFDLIILSMFGRNYKSRKRKLEVEDATLAPYEKYRALK